MQETDAPILLPRQTSFLPWLLFAIALVAGGGAFVVEKQTADSDAARLATLERSEAKARADGEELAAAKRTLEQRVAELQTENGKLSVKIAAAESVKVRPAVAMKSSKGRKHHKRKHV
jgi:cell division protein FtsB